jgi:hypothetical protein
MGFSPHMELNTFPRGFFCNNILLRTDIKPEEVGGASVLNIGFVPNIIGTYDLI